jgi:hypothetical protein
VGVFLPVSWSSTSQPLADGTGTPIRSAETAFDAANDRFAAAEQALDAARDERARVRQERYAAWQAYGQASTTVARLQRQVGELAARLDRMSSLPAFQPSATPRVTPSQTLPLFLMCSCIVNRYTQWCVSSSVEFSPEALGGV